MGEIGWLVTGQRSDEVIVTAPGAIGVDEAVGRLDDALAGFAGPVPGWFEAVSRLGRWWYLVCAVVAVPVALVLAPGSPLRGALVGLVGTVALALVSGLLMARVARSQSRRPDGLGRDRTIAEQAHLARPMPVLQDAVRGVVVHSPAREREVHDLAWRVCGHDHGDASQAIHELVALWRTVDPVAGAQEAEHWAEDDEQPPVARDR